MRFVIVVVVLRKVEEGLEKEYKDESGSHVARGSIITCKDHAVK